MDQTALRKTAPGAARLWFNSETGTIHKLHEPTQLLRLLAQVGLPPQLMDMVTIPHSPGHPPGRR